MKKEHASMANGNERITCEMDIDELLFIMSDGHEGAAKCLVGYLREDPMNLLWILMLDSVGIYGEEIYNLWNFYCNKSYAKMEEIITKLSNGEICIEDLNIS